MPVNDFELINPSGQVSAREFERLGETAKAHAKFVAGQGLMVAQNSGGFQLLTQDPVVFFAKITGNAAGTPAPHAWTQQRQNGDGTLADDAEGNAGTTTYFPAYSTDGGVIPTNTIVRLYLSVGGDYYLVYPSPSGATGSMLEVKESDGSPDVLNVTTLIVDQATGLGIESGASPTVTLKCRDASATQIGVVNLSDQVMGAGVKRHIDHIYLINLGVSATVLGWGQSTVGTPDTGELYLLNDSPAADFYTFHVDLFIGFAAIDLITDTSSITLGETKFLVTQQFANRGKVFFAIKDGSGEVPGITGSGLTSVDVVGGIVTGGSSASAAPFADTTALVKGSVDATKQLRFEVDGFTAGATRVLTPQDADYTIAGLQTTAPFTAVQTFSASPTAPFGSGTNSERFGSGAGNNSASNDYHSAFGKGALASLSSGTEDDAFGYHSLNACTTGTQNSCFGGETLPGLTNGSRNTVAGSNAGEPNANPNDAVLVGFQCGQHLTSQYACVVGSQAAKSSTSGDYNTIVGANNCNGSASGVALTTGAQNTVLGAFADTAANNTASAIALGFSAVAASNEFAVGPNINFQTWYGTSSTSTRQRADLTVSWITSTDATRKARAVLNVWDTAAREAIRLDATGSAAQVGVGGAVNGSYLLTINGSSSEVMGSGTGFMTKVGLAGAQTSSAGVGNGADTTDDTLFTYSLPLNSLSANGKCVRVRASGTFAVSVNLKQVKMWFGGTALADSGALTLSGKDWTIEAEVVRLDATHVSTVGSFSGDTASAAGVTVKANLAVSDLTSNATTIKVTGASTVAGTANEVLGYMMRIDFVN